MLVRGVVGWVDLAAADAVATLGALAADPLLKGVRPMLQDLPDPAWILRPDVQPALAALPALGLRFDALVTPRELKPLARCRSTAIPISPSSSITAPSPTSPTMHGSRGPTTLRRSRGTPRAYCKLSGLVTEAGRGWTVDALRRYVDASARLLRHRAPDVGQRLAGAHARGELCRLGRGRR